MNARRRDSPTGIAESDERREGRTKRSPHSNAAVPDQTCTSSPSYNLSPRLEKPSPRVAPHTAAAACPPRSNTPVSKEVRTSAARGRSRTHARTLRKLWCVMNNNNNDDNKAGQQQKNNLLGSKRNATAKRRRRAGKRMRSTTRSGTLSVIGRCGARNIINATSQTDRHIIGGESEQKDKGESYHE